MIGILDSSPYGLSRFYDRETPPLRLSRKTLIAVGLVAAFHVGIGVVIAHTYFAAPSSPALPEDPVITLNPLTPAKPPPPRPAATQPKPQEPQQPAQIDQHEPPQDVEVAAAEFTAPVLPHLEGTPAGTVITPPEPPKVVTPPPTPPVITNPNWISRPTPEQVGQLYPALAAQRGIGGKATLLCEVMVTGAVGNCTVVDETPKNYRFGAAAQAMTRYFKLSPRTVDGVSVAGSKVRIPVVFNLS